MFEVKKSQIASVPNFALMVQAYSADMKVWRDHMRLVEKDAADDSIPIPDKHTKYPAPEANYLVASALNENFEPEFVVKNDDPLPSEVLEDKKNLLLLQLQSKEQEARNFIDPPLKRRINYLRAVQIEQADNAVAVATNAELMGERQNVTNAERVEFNEKIEAAKIAARSPDDQVFLEENAARLKKLSDADLIAAQAQSDIDDLTTETVDSWKMPTFPTA